MSKIASAKEIFNEAGELLKIEYYDTDGKHIIDAEWDTNEEQTVENRKAFREWADKFVKHNKGFVTL